MDTTAKTAAPTYTKEKLLTFRRFAERRDALCAALDDNKEYTPDEAEKLLRQFLKGKVK